MAAEGDLSQAGERDAPLTEEELRVAELLESGRPLPEASFRGVLRRHLVAADPGWGPRPERLAVIVALYLLVGLALIAVAALVGVAPS